MSFDILTAPGLTTDEEHPSKPDGTAAVDLRELVALGYEWVSYQVVNGTAVNPKGIDIQKYGGASGFQSCGVWGVVYDVADFYNFGYRLGREAIRQGAEHVIVDAEECSKYTDDDEGMKPIVDGLYDAGWDTAVHLCPLGCPTNAVPYGPNDYHCDTKSYLDTGGGVIPQAYYNAHANYRPDLCVDYWTAIGVPFERLNVMIELAFENSKIEGAEWSSLLDDAGVHRGFSVYMIQHGTDADWEGLKPHSMPGSKPGPPTPEPEPEDEMEPVSDQQGRDAIGFAYQAAAQNWTDDKPRGRLTIAARIAQAANDDTKWNACRDDVKGALDRAGVPDVWSGE
jgi:hypothetical protein